MTLAAVQACNEAFALACVDMTQASDYGSYLTADPGQPPNANQGDMDVLQAALMGLAQGIDLAANDLLASPDGGQVS